MIHLSFLPPLFPFLSSARLLLLNLLLTLNLPAKPRWDDDDLADLDHYTFPLYQTLLLGLELLLQFLLLLLSKRLIFFSAGPAVGWAAAATWP